MEIEPGKLDVGRAVGTAGTLTVIKDLNMKEPYVGTIGLFSGEIADDLAMYFVESEQIPHRLCPGRAGEHRPVGDQRGWLSHPAAARRRRGHHLQDPEAGVRRVGSVSRALEGGLDACGLLEAVLSDFELGDPGDPSGGVPLLRNRDRVTLSAHQQGEQEQGRGKKKPHLHRQTGQRGGGKVDKKREGRSGAAAFLLGKKGAVQKEVFFPKNTGLPPLERTATGGGEICTPGEREERDRHLGQVTIPGVSSFQWELRRLSRLAFETFPLGTAIGDTSFGLRALRSSRRHFSDYSVFIIQQLRKRRQSWIHFRSAPARTQVQVCSALGAQPFAVF